MTINTFDKKMPPLFYKSHVGWRMQYFINHFVLPEVVGKPLTEKEKDKDVTIGFIDTHKCVVSYKGEALCFIVLVGADFSFFKK
jgi:hypothetical protein